MKLFFLLLLHVLILPQSAQSLSVDDRFHGSSSIPIIASFVECLFIKTFYHRKYLTPCQPIECRWLVVPCF